MYSWVETYDVHFNGRNLLYSDGHVKWRISNKIPAQEFGLKDTTTFGPSLANTATIDPALVG